MALFSILSLLFYVSIFLYFFYPLVSSRCKYLLEWTPIKAGWLGYFFCWRIYLWCVQHVCYAFWSRKYIVLQLKSTGSIGYNGIPDEGFSILGLDFFILSGILLIYYSWELPVSCHAFGWVFAPVKESLSFLSRWHHCLTFSLLILFIL